MSRRSLRFVLTFSLLIFSCVIVADDGTGTARVKSVQEHLDRKLPEINFRDNQLSEVIDFLRDVTGANIFVNWRALELAGIPKETKLTVQIKDVRFEKALRMILDRLGGGKMTVNYEVDEGIITISTAEDLRKNTITKSYDVRDLLKMSTDAPPPATEKTVEGKRPVGDRQERVEALFKLVTGTVDPESWRDNGGQFGAIKELHGQLIVTQTKENQKVIENLLTQTGKLIKSEAMKK